MTTAWMELVEEMGEKAPSIKGSNDGSIPSQVSKISKKYNIDSIASEEGNPYPVEMAAHVPTSKDKASRIAEIDKWRDHALRYMSLPDDAWVPIPGAPPSASLTVTAALSETHGSLGAAQMRTEVDVPFHLVSAALLSPITVSDWHIYMRQHVILEMENEYRIAYTSYTEIDTPLHQDFVCICAPFKLGTASDGIGFLIAGTEHESAPERVEEYNRIKKIMMYFEILPLNDNRTQVSFTLERFEAELGVTRGVGISIIGMKVPLFFYFLREFLVNLAITEASVKRFIMISRNVTRNTIYSFRENSRQVVMEKGEGWSISRILKSDKESPPVLFKCSVVVDAPVHDIKACLMSSVEWSNVMMGSRLVDIIDHKHFIGATKFSMDGINLIPLNVLVAGHEFTATSFSFSVVSISPQERSNSVGKENEPRPVPLLLPSTMYVHSMTASQSFVMVSVSMDSKYILKKASQDVSNEELLQSFRPCANMLIQELESLKNAARIHTRRFGRFLTNMPADLLEKEREERRIEALIHSKAREYKARTEVVSMPRRIDEIYLRGDSVQATASVTSTAVDSCESQAMTHPKSSKKSSGRKRHRDEIEEDLMRNQGDSASVRVRT